MSITAQARSRREMAVNQRLGHKTGRAAVAGGRKVSLREQAIGKISKTARKSGAK
jgi:hypothetical protein